ncbi:hypothetical protein EH240_12705 [Mesorhizobium tamadayense]|uniref:Class I SAM-dependent methyltransferase n=1 Tax=Mesorhizobium tamadayense TaxID=425306 RepID=A0A3P3FUN9_9HYPH|nr:hypothetical protein [Mesorhizobium tamadayense]RRI02320.1 hypothetical protein EH240_12705 [Mesorhizobium tamadayense]
MMGKRSNYPRISKDFYPTPAKAVLPLLPFLRPGTRFIEPCGGDGALISHLEAHGHTCVGAVDIEPRHRSIVARDALTLTTTDVVGAECFITNLPWSRPVLHPLLAHLKGLLPLWTIIDSNWAHTIQAGPHMHYCSQVVSIGRVRWIPGTSSDGKDDASWYRFEAVPTETIFKGRAALSDLRSVEHNPTSVPGATASRHARHHQYSSPMTPKAKETKG